MSLYLITSYSYSMEYKQSTEDILTATLYYEARNQGEVGMRAVASIIWNRAHEKHWQKLGLAGVCTQKMQFSCWNGKSKLTPITEGYPDKKALIICKKIAREMINNTFVPTHNGNHYLTTSLAKKVKKSHWRWSMKNTQVIGDHLFGRL